MKGVITSYRRSKTRTYNNQVIIQPKESSSREDGEKLVGKKVTWNTGKRAIEGVVASAHGKQGALRARFTTGMPGQCLGKEVTIQ